LPAKGHRADDDAVRQRPAWLIAGSLAVAGGVYRSRRNDGRAASYSSSQNNQQNNPPPPPPPCTDLSAKK